MIKYKNISFSAKTFYGTIFEPGETKEVSGYINCTGMVRIFDDEESEPPKKRISEDPVPVVTKKRRKSNETEKVSIAETITTIDLSKEETSNGNPS